MIADAELALDQVGDARAGPQRGFVAQLLGAFEQQLRQLLLLGRVQQRLAAGASGLLHAPTATAPIGVHPPVDALTNHPHPAGNGGLRLAPFPEPNRFQPSLLQSIKIAAPSSWISHAYLDAQNWK
jgi:hypothetical protein